jgi:hypothetical protein
VTVAPDPTVRVLSLIAAQEAEVHVDPTILVLSPIATKEAE